MAEKEYIEREALLYEIDKCEPMNWTGSDAENQADIDHACYRGLVETAPAADVVEVVRCKGCRYWGGATFGYICRRFSGTTLRNETRECDYCSFGERRDTDG